MKLLSFLFLLPLAACGRTERQHELPYTCAESCFRVLRSVKFVDDVKGYFYERICSGELRTQSIFQCMKLYCKPEYIEPGWKYINSDCETSAYTPLPAYHVNASLTHEMLLHHAIEDESRFNEDSILNDTIVPYPDIFNEMFQLTATYDYEYLVHHRYSMAMYIFWGAIIFISLAKRILTSSFRIINQHQRFDKRNISSPARSSLQRLKVKFNYLVLTRATFGKRSVQPYGWCTVPPLIEMLVIFTFVLVNVLLCSFGYDIYEGNKFLHSGSQQILRYLGNRNGVMALSNLPLIWLFGTRNNILIWLTGWSPATFNSFHRWVARLATLEAIIHGICWSIHEYMSGKGNYEAEWTWQYWIFGAVAVVAMSFLLCFSIYGLRRWAYDVFLVIHITLAVVTLVAMFYHLSIFEGGFDPYLWSCVAIWVLDRFMRISRIIILNFGRWSRSKMAMGYYSPESNLIRLTVPINRPASLIKGKFYYLYVLHGRSFFQSHPFTSVFATSASDCASDSFKGRKDIKVSVATIDAAFKAPIPEKSPIVTTSEQLKIDYSRLCFYIRPLTGFSKHLQKRIMRHDKQNAGVPLRVLIEGPYSSQESLHHFDNILLIIGGSGITVGIQYLQTLVGRKEKSSKNTPGVHIIWAVREPETLEEFRDEMVFYSNSLDAKMTLHTTGEKDIPHFSRGVNGRLDGGKGAKLARWPVVLPGRPNLQEYVINERMGKSGTLAVVSCCPPQMTDATRAAVVECMKTTEMDVTYLQESFS